MLPSLSLSYIIINIPVYIYTGIYKYHNVGVTLGGVSFPPCARMEFANSNRILFCLLGGATFALVAPTGEECFGSIHEGVVVRTEVFDDTG